VFGFEMAELTSDLFLQEDRIVRMGNPPMRLEITTGISGVEFEECYDHRVVDDLDGVEVNIIDLASLKVNKEAAGRSKDRMDLEILP
jgi:hypothetical protein